MRKFKPFSILIPSLCLLLLSCNHGNAGSSIVPKSAPFKAPTPGSTEICNVNEQDDQIPDIAFQEFVTDLSLPVQVTHAGDGSGRLFVVEKEGRVRIVLGNVLSDEYFLDISDRVHNSGEMGLLGMAFHPQFSSNGKFYLNYVSSNQADVNQCDGTKRCSLVSEFTLSNSQKLEDSERIIISIAQPYGNHNGGQIAFGPEQPNPYLYIGMGDGGSGGDPHGHAQDLSSLLGAMLRIDVNNTDPELNYAIPEDNPVWSQAKDARREIWAYGLRNPWRFSFDLLTGDLYAGDVGQNTTEEIDIIKKGLNYGWKEVEGDGCYQSGCDISTFEPPIAVHKADDGWRSINGGQVYRGTEITDLCGVYLYSDYVGGSVMGLRYDALNGVSSSKVLGKLYSVVAFGVDENHEIYAVSLNEGALYRVVKPLR